MVAKRQYKSLDELYIPEPNSGCWIWTKAISRRYGSLVYQGKQIPAHRAFYQMLVGPIPTGLLVCHKCDNPLCVNPDHLFLGTQSDNMLDMFRKGRSKQRRGFPLHKAKITKEIADRIKTERGTQISIAKRYGICQQMVSNIKLGKAW